MIKKLLIAAYLFILSFHCQAQFSVTVQAGYCLPIGTHHSDYENKLLDKTGYDNSKSLSYSTATKIDYNIKKLNIGLGLEIGKFQTEKSTEIIGLGSLFPTTSFIATTGNYVLPNIYLQYSGQIAQKITLRIGLSLGMFITGFDKDNSILVVETESLLGGIIPAQSFGVLAQTGQSGNTNSNALSVGGQLELGYNINKNFNIHLEWASRRSNVDATASIFGIEQPLDYALWIHTIRVGLRYSIHKFPKINITQKQSSKNDAQHI